MGFKSLRGPAVLIVLLCEGELLEMTFEQPIKGPLPPSTYPAIGRSLPWSGEGR